MGAGGTKDKAISPELCCFIFSKLQFWEIFTAQYLHSWRLSMEKLKITSLKEKIIECDWNCYSICWYFSISVPSQETVTFFTSRNIKKIMNEMLQNSQLPWYITLKHFKHLCTCCSVLFWLDWLRSLCRSQRCELPDELCSHWRLFQQCLTKEVSMQIRKSTLLAHVYISSCP